MRTTLPKQEIKLHVLHELEERYMFVDQKLNRPEIHWVHVLTCIACTIVCEMFLVWCLAQLGHSIGVVKGDLKTTYVVLFSFISCAVLCLWRKRIFIFFIHVYQRYAPYPVRATCLFIPSCSDYTILAIQKYGAIRGLIMGIKRFKRCEPPNGGVDYP